MKGLLFIFFYGFAIYVTLAQHPKQFIAQKQDYGILYQYNDSLQCETYPRLDGWAYRIYLRYKLLINQPVVPAVDGNLPFKSEADARKIAELAASKIAKGQMPPTLSIEEIQNQINLKKHD